MSSEKEKSGLPPKSRLIRKYRPEDRDAVRYICSETGFLGDPQEVVVLDREVFADMWSGYWTDREPESLFVAEWDGRVVGYLLGCLDTDRQEKIFSKEMARPLLRKAVRRGFFIRPKNAAFLYRMIRSIARREFKVPLKEIKAEYPAHLHTNIADPWMRGKGLGWGMMEAYFDYLRDNNVKGLHLGTTSHNKQAVPFYHRCGFEIIHKSRFTGYDHVVPDLPVYMLYFARKL